MERYIVFDVETPNSVNERMSAIGITLVDGREISGGFYSLVDPEQRFDRFNVALTGITPEAVRGQPAFPQLWERIGPLMGSGLLVAHNAPFDMAVLSKCLRAYGIRWRERAPYIDTVRMARQAFPSLPNHKLDTLSAALGIELDHHDAGSDAEACARIFLASIECGAEPGAFLREYDLLRCSTLKGAVGRG